MTNTEDGRRAALQRGRQDAAWQVSQLLQGSQKETPPRRAATSGMEAEVEWAWGRRWPGTGLGAAVAGALQQGRLPLCDTPQHTCPCRLHFSD